jgi:predicted acyltransferase (DUF342 family)
VVEDVEDELLDVVDGVKDDGGDDDLKVVEFIGAVDNVNDVEGDVGVKGNVEVEHDVEVEDKVEVEDNVEVGGNVEFEHGVEVEDKVEVLFDIIEVVVLDDVAFAVEELLLDEAELEEELLLPPPAHVLDKSAVLLNASAIVPAEPGLPLMTSNLAVNAWLEVIA